MPDTPSEPDYDQEPEDPSPEFVKGFNEGYLLSAYAPEIGGIFGAYAPETERGKGFREGKQQYAFEDKSEPARDKTSDHLDNQMSMGIKETPEQKMEKFQQSKSEQGMARQRYPDWLQERKEQNKDDMGIEKATDVIQGAKEKLDQDKKDVDLDKEH